MNPNENNLGNNINDKSILERDEQNIISGKNFSVFDNNINNEKKIEKDIELDNKSTNLSTKSNERNNEKAMNTKNDQFLYTSLEDALKHFNTKYKNADTDHAKNHNIHDIKTNEIQFNTNYAINEEYDGNIEDFNEDVDDYIMKSKLINENNKNDI
jgi:hypothetical protein